jgi:hypothetical protein
MIHGLQDPVFQRPQHAKMPRNRLEAGIGGDLSPGDSKKTRPSPQSGPQ